MAQASSMNGNNLRRLYNMAVAVLLAKVAATSVMAFMAALRTPLALDDP